MKKATAILFLQVYLFNLVGYQFGFDHAMNRLETESITRLDNGHYDSSELIEVKIPLSLPYYNQQQDQYERYDGQIQVNGVWIDFVQRRVSGDTLYLLCLPNKDKTKLQEARHNQAASESGQSAETRQVVKKAQPDNESPREGIPCESGWNYISTPNSTRGVPPLVTCVIGIRPEPPRKDC